MIRADVVVIGGGISGLSTAWWLQRAGVDVIVLEKEKDVGGTMKTLRQDGWLVELGPNSTLETTPLIGQILRETGIEGERRYADASGNKRYILRNGTLHALPMSPAAFFGSRLWTLPGKLRLLKEPFVGRAIVEESVADFVERRLGREFLDYAINPFVSGVYAGRPEKLSVRYAFPKLYALEERYGGLIRGMIGGRRERKKRAETAKDRARMFSFAGGMHTFPLGIAAKLGERVRTEVAVTGVEHGAGTSGSGRFRVSFTSRGIADAFHASAVVLSTPSSGAAELLGRIAPDCALRVKQIYYPPVAEIFFGFRAEQVGCPLDGFGFLVPEREKRKILGTIWSSSLFEGRAPGGNVALTTFAGGARQPEVAALDDNELGETVLRELRDIMGIMGSPVFSRIIRWPRAIPQYEVGYGTVLSAIDETEQRVPGLFLCSNYRGGIAVGDCIMSGERTATRVQEFLSHNTSHSSAGVSYGTH
jgi:oxygen-dependent protoporphyrinogen oxidase